MGRKRRHDDSIFGRHERVLKEDQPLPVSNLFSPAHLLFLGAQVSWAQRMMTGHYWNVKFKVASFGMLHCWTDTIYIRKQIMYASLVCGDLCECLVPTARDVSNF